MQKYEKMNKGGKWEKNLNIFLNQFGAVIQQIKKKVFIRKP